MNIITDFSNLDTLNTYYLNTIKYSLSNNLIFELNPGTDHFLSLDAATQQNIESSIHQHYIYIGSKTNFRKTIFPDVIESCYKKLYSTLKKNLYILEASAARVIFNSKDITQDMFLDMNSDYTLYDDHLKVLTSVINRINDAEADKLYYQKVIETLLQRCSHLEDELANAYQQVHNKTISTWY